MHIFAQPTPPRETVSGVWCCSCRLYVLIYSTYTVHILNHRCTYTEISRGVNVYIHWIICVHTLKFTLILQCTFTEVCRARCRSWRLNTIHTVCCSVLQCVAVCCSVLHCEAKHYTQCVVVCCSVLQCVAMCCSVLQCVAVCCSVRLNTIHSVL